MYDGTRMEKFTFVSKRTISQLPTGAGVYAFKHGKTLLYIGKAINIRERVKNHFGSPGYKDTSFLDQTTTIGFLETDSAIEALILEATLIKKHQPKFNVMWRDDKNYFYVGVTKEEHPRVFITHQPKEKSKVKSKKPKVKYVGPFVDGSSLKKTLRFLRKIFPYLTVKQHSKTPCLWCHLELCPGPHPRTVVYKQNIKNLVAVLNGKRKSVLQTLQKEMKAAASHQQFERAAIVRDQVSALENIVAHASIIAPIKNERERWDTIQAMLQTILKHKGTISRIEGYDIANIQGKQATGSMVVFVNGYPDKSLYRKFKIKLPDKPNDVAMIKEILQIRCRHPEWNYPDLIFIDGGKGQLNAAKAAVQRNKTLNCPLVALAKGKNELYIERSKKPTPLKDLPQPICHLMLQIRDEAHRFARAYHHRLRSIDLRKDS